MLFKSYSGKPALFYKFLRNQIFRDVTNEISRGWFVKWSGTPDSNREPLRPERSALPIAPVPDDFLAPA